MGEHEQPMVLGIDGLARLLGVSTRALRMRILRGSGAPLPLRLGGRLAWRREDVVAWLDQEARGQGVAYSAGSQETAPGEPPRRRPGRPRKKEGRRA